MWPALTEVLRPFEGIGHQEFHGAPLAIATPPPLAPTSLVIEPVRIPSPPAGLVGHPVVSTSCQVPRIELRVGEGDPGGERVVELVFFGDSVLHYNLYRFHWSEGRWLVDEEGGGTWL